MAPSLAFVTPDDFDAFSIGGGTTAVFLGRECLHIASTPKDAAEWIANTVDVINGEVMRVR